MFQSHPKDFARRELAEIFIFQYNFTGKLEAHFQVLQLVLAHTDKTGRCVKK